MVAGWNLLQTRQRDACGKSPCLAVDILSIKCCQPQKRVLQGVKENQMYRVKFWKC